MPDAILLAERQATATAAAAEHVQHKFAPIEFRGQHWDLGHLDPFAYHREIVLNQASDARLTLEIVVLFSCHCFTQSLENDGRSPIPAAEIYKTDRETRALCEERYSLSLILLRGLVEQLPSRKIIVARPGENYVTFERHGTEGVQHYGVFFEVAKAKSRKNRIILRVQSAYLREPTQRHREAKKVGFDTLLRAAHEGRVIRP